MNPSYGARAYAAVGLETKLPEADPRELILMLYDGALLAVRDGRRQIGGRDFAAKGRSLSKAIQIIEQGLRASLDRSAGGAIATQLDSLYEYMAQRVLVASVRNETAALDEVERLLVELRSAWAAIGEDKTARSARPAALRT
jgi:flagellar protein FliS